MSDISPRSLPSVESMHSPPRAKSTFSVSFSSETTGRAQINGDRDKDNTSVASSNASSLPQPVSKRMEREKIERSKELDPSYNDGTLNIHELDGLSDDEISLMDNGSTSITGRETEGHSIKNFSSFLLNNNFELEESHNPLTQLICSQNKKRVPNWEEVLLYMQANPSQCKRLHGWDEELPLHWALREKAPVYIIQPLLEIFPEGSSCRGRHGAIPLWYAICTPREADDMKAIVKMLLERYPHGVRLKVDKLLPLHMAVELDVDPEIIGMLLHLDLPFTDEGFPITYHAFSWSWLIENTGDKYMSIIQETVVSHRSIAQELAKAQTERGSIALQVGHSDIRQTVFNEAFFCGRYEIMKSHLVHKSSSVVVVHAIDHKADLSYAQAFDDQMLSVNNDSSSETSKKKTEMNETHFVAALQRVGGYVNSNSKDLVKIFGHNEHDDSGKAASISKLEFVRYCKSIFKSPREVVLKFMSNEISFLREVNSRSSCNLDCRYVVHILNTLSGDNFEDAMNKLQLPGVKSMDGFKYGIVLPVADRNLESICIHEDLDTIHICKIMKDLALALQHIHSRGMCHGDVRMRNVIRISERYCFIDLTSSSNLEIFYIQDADMYGSKFATANLPPEMFVKLSGHGESSIGKYWSTSPNFESMWPGVKPVHTPFGTYSVRAYDIDLKTKRPRDLHMLPYSPMSASVNIDMWGFGLLLYNLVSGEPLLYSSRNDNLVNPTDYSTAALWTEASLQKKIDQNVLDPIAADLIMQLLQPNPEQRPSSMKEVLDHVYFSALDDGARKSVNGQKMEEIFTAHAQRTQENEPSHFIPTSPITQQKRRSATPNKELTGPVYEITSRSIYAEVKRTHNMLRRSLFESGDTYIPTCFIIVNQLLSSTEEKMARSSILSVDSNSVESELSEEKSNNATQLVVSEASGPAFFRKSQAQVARRWYNYFYTITKAQRNNYSDCSEVIAGEIKKICAEEELYLYFLDEVTMQVVKPDKKSKKFESPTYPIRVTNAEELIPKIFPLMKLSLHAIAAFRDMEVMCRSFGFPTDSLEEVDIHAVNPLGEISSASAERDYEDITRLIQESDLMKMLAPKPTSPKNDLSSNSSASTNAKPDASLYKILSTKVFTDDSDIMGIKNPALKELGIFYAAHDVVNGYGKLRKVQVKDNIVVFSSKSNVEKFMRNISESNGDKGRSNQSKRGSSDSLLSAGNGLAGVGSGTISVDEVNDNVIQIRKDVQRLQYTLEKMIRRDEQKMKESEIGCTAPGCYNGCQIS